MGWSGAVASPAARPRGPVRRHPFRRRTYPRGRVRASRAAPCSGGDREPEPTQRCRAPASDADHREVVCAWRGAVGYREVEPAPAPPVDVLHPEEHRVARPRSRRAAGQQVVEPAVREEVLPAGRIGVPPHGRSEEHTSELQSRENLVCRLLLEKKKKKKKNKSIKKKKKKKK